MAADVVDTGASGALGFGYVLRVLFGPLRESTNDALFSQDSLPFARPRGANMTERVAVAELEAALKRLDEVLEPIARRPVDITQPGWLKKLETYDPLEEANI